MKKLSLLVALFMCLTIGGVYATWQYAGTNDIADAFAETKVTIADAELTGANGTYKVESNLVLSVDQANKDHEAKLVFASNNGSAIFLKVTFTPAQNAPKEVKQGAVPSELYFGTTVPMQYRMDLATGNFDANGTPVNIFKFSNESNGDLDVNITWTKYSNKGTDTLSDDEAIADENAFGDYFTYTLNEDQLKTMIMLNDTVKLAENDIRSFGPFVLDTKHEHDVFGGHVEYDPEGHPGVKEGLVGNILVRVTDGTVN